MHAVDSNNVNIIRMLLKSGAKVNAIDDYGHSTIMLVPLSGNTEIIKILMTLAALLITMKEMAKQYLCMMSILKI